MKNSKTILSKQSVALVNNRILKDFKKSLKSPEYNHEKPIPFHKIQLVLTEKEIDGLCKDCGSCCRDLTLQDKIELTRFFGRIIVEDICPFSSKYGCVKYKDRAPICREWKCGVVEILRGRLENK